MERYYPHTSESKNELMFRVQINIVHSGTVRNEEGIYILIHIMIERKNERLKKKGNK